MQVIQFLHTTLAAALPQVHAMRLRSLLEAVAAALAGAPLSLTGLGRWLPSSALVKHAIKQIDRLLGNRHLQGERLAFYGHLLHQVLRRESTPVVVVDWSHADERKQLFILRASLLIAGRSLPVFEAAHDRENCPAFQRRFLQQLARLMPCGCRPIVITDAGFGRKWFAAVAALGWHYVGRVRNREGFARPGRVHWYSVKALSRAAKLQPEDLGAFEMTRHRLPVRVVRVKRPPKGRVYRGRLGQRSADSRSKQCAKRAREPWVLVSNLAPPYDANDIVTLYTRRMRIEEGFRDLKCVRYGLGLRLQASTTAARLNILLLIGAIATFAIYLCGLYARHQGYTRSYQANTSTAKVLSLFSLGRQWLRRPDHPTVGDWRLAHQALVEAMMTATILA